MSIQFVLSICALASIVGAIIAWPFAERHGIRKGRDEGQQLGRDLEWQDQYFAQIAADRARRNRFGQFKAKEHA